MRGLVRKNMIDAKPEHIPKLIEMGFEFWKASQMPLEFNPNSVAAFLEGLIASDSAVVLMSDHGCIGGALAPAYCDPDWMIAVELFWWADKGGVPLLRGFEDWAKSMGASEIRMTSLASLPRADRLLRIKGYKPCEISYQRVL